MSVLLSDVFDAQKARSTTRWEPHILCCDTYHYLFFHPPSTTFLANLQEVLDVFDIYGEVIRIPNSGLTTGELELFQRCFPAKSIKNPMSADAFTSTYSFIQTHFVHMYKAMRNLVGPSFEKSVTASTYKPKPDMSPDYLLYSIPGKLCVVVNDTKVSRNIWASMPDDFVVCESQHLHEFASMFHKKLFPSVDIVKTKMAKLDEVVNVDAKTTSTTTESTPSALTLEKQRVTSYLHFNYTINDSQEPEFRKKAQDIAEELERDLNIPRGESNSFRIRLSSYLLEMGLKKKRFSFGYYYYGLAKKQHLTNIAALSSLTLDDIAAQRDKDLLSPPRDTSAFMEHVTGLDPFESAHVQLAHTPHVVMAPWEAATL